MTERRVLSRMRHPFIIRLHWAISTSTTLSLVLDYCPGGDLYFHLRKEGTFAHESVRLYAAEVLLAIQVRGEPPNDRLRRWQAWLALLASAAQ